MTRTKRILALVLFAVTIGQAASAGCDSMLTDEFATVMGVAAHTGDFRSPKLRFGNDYEDLIGLPCDQPGLLQAALVAKGWEANGLGTRTFPGDSQVTTLLIMRSQRTGFLGFLVGGYIGHLSMSFVDGKLEGLSVGPSDVF